MHFHALILAALAGLGAVSAANDTIPELFASFPDCGILCYSDACEDVMCDPTDLNCVCPNPASLTVKMGICVGKQCDREQKAIDDEFDSGKMLAEICDRFDHSKPSSSEIAAAKATISSRINVVKPKTTSSSAGSEAGKTTNAAPAMTRMPIAALGAAAVAALAL